MTADLEATRNRILAALPGPVLDQLREHLEPVELNLGAVLYEPGRPISHVHFVLIGVVSLVAELDDEQVVEVATVGDEGMVGLPVFLGAGPPTERASVQVAGHAVRLTAEAFRHIVAVIDGPMQTALQRYTQAMFTQLARNAACIRAHNVRQRCARWLLMTADRMHTDAFDLTQEFLAQMLAVRRATVSEVAAALAADGVITYRRGHITLLHRDQLETITCDCYQVIRDTFATAYNQHP